MRSSDGAHGEAPLAAKSEITFDRYWLNLVHEQLWCGDQDIPLPGKGFATLRYLVEHAGQLVSKGELFAALWPGTVVSDNALTFWITALRKALGDNAKTPRLIETVHRRGYRFIGEVQSLRSKVPGPKFEPAPNIQHPTPILVGREAELLQLHNWLAKALDGERQIVFVTGEPGIGKTSLIDAFLAQSSCRVGMAHHSDDPRLAGSVGSPHPTSAAPSSSLRAPCSLLPASWLAQGQCEAHRMLSEVYNWFTEGFDTKDLQEAKELLEELNH